MWDADVRTTPEDNALHSAGQGVEGAVVRDLGAPEQTSCCRANHVYSGLFKAVFHQLAMGAVEGDNAYDDD